MIISQRPEGTSHITIQTSDLIGIGRKSWPSLTFATRKRLVAASLRMCDLIVHASDSNAGNQSHCDLDASVNDALKIDY